MIRITLFLIFVVVGFSCSIKYYPMSKSELDKNREYDYFYVVDTIEIADPIIIRSPKVGGQFIISQSILHEYNGKKEFFARPDVFILSYELYRVLPLDKFSKYQYLDFGGCSKINRENSEFGLQIYKYESEKVRFILGLINAKYYWLNYASYDYYDLPDRFNLNTYYRIVFPICE